MPVAAKVVAEALTSAFVGVTAHRQALSSWLSVGTLLLAKCARRPASIPAR
jgi:hypothetical protein